MTSPSTEAHYHVVEFERSIEAAAFVAALSRVLDSPRRTTRRGSNARVEVWTYSPPAGGAVRLYLSDAALEEARAAFAPLPVTAVLRADALPAQCALVLTGREAPLGTTDAERRLSSP